MKKTYKYIALAALALGFAACTQDDDFAPQQEDIVKIASANIATEVQTRVNTLDGGTEWENNDQILLVNNSRTTKNSGIYTATLSGVSTYWSLTEGLVLYASGTNNFTAYYPAVADEEYTLPTDQGTAANIKYADRMVATTNGVAKGESVALHFERQHAMITINPTLATEFTGQSIDHLNIGNIIVPYHLEDEEGYTAIIAPSENGFGVTVTVGNQQLTAATFTKIEAGKHYTFNLKVGKDLMEMETVSVAPWNQLGIGDGNAEEIPYLTFTAEAEQTMKIRTYTYGTHNYTLHESLQYSVNGGEWTQLTAETPITFGGDKGTLRLRGKSSEGTAILDAGYALVSFGNSDVEVACSGDIRTLVDYASYATVSTANASFQLLFAECRNLTTAPELPATELASCCYNGMFQNCVSLTTAPELPATELADHCYYDMFYGCTSLTAAPELPATELANNCYQAMFRNCTNLIVAPELPATTLADACYYYMFSGCSSLTAAPELPATTLVFYCYNSMFEGCSNLNDITMLATNIFALDCLLDWVSGVAPSGTLTKSASLVQGSETGQIPTGTSGIPEGWTVVDKQ